MNRKREFVSKKMSSLEKQFSILKSPVIKRATSNEIKLISISGGTGKVNKPCISHWGCKGEGVGVVSLI